MVRYGDGNNVGMRGRRLGAGRMGLGKEGRAGFDEKPRLDERFRDTASGYAVLVLCCCWLGSGKKKSGMFEPGRRVVLILLAPSVCRLSPQLLAGFGPVCCGFMREIFSSRSFVCNIFSSGQASTGPKGAPRGARGAGPLCSRGTHRWGDIIKPTPPGTPVVRGTAGKGAGRRAVIDRVGGCHWPWASEHRRFWHQCSSAKSPEAPRFSAPNTPRSGRRRGVDPLPDFWPGSGRAPVVQSASRRV